MLIGINGGYFPAICRVCFTNKARKLKVAESNQAKASLTKQWLATDEANRSLVVCEEFARR